MVLPLHDPARNRRNDPDHRFAPIEHLEDLAAGNLFLDFGPLGLHFPNGNCLHDGKIVAEFQNVNVSVFILKFSRDNSAGTDPAIFGGDAVAKDAKFQNRIR